MSEPTRNIKCRAFLFANYISDTTGVPRSIIDIYDTVNVANIPVIIPQFTIYLLLANLKKNDKVQIKVIHPGGQILQSNELLIDTDPNSNEANVQIIFRPLVCPEFGEYQIQLFVNQTHIDTRILRVMDNG